MKPDCLRSRFDHSKCPEKCKNRLWQFDEGISGEAIKGCILEKITKQSFAYITAHDFYESKGHYPSPGGWQNQSAKLLQVFSCINKEIALIETEKAEQIQKKANQK
jgi:hypothetical protein